MPYPKKPNRLKVLSGSRQPDTPLAVEFPLVDERPPAPSWLPNAHAVNEWDRLTPILFHNKLLTEASLSTLGVLCATFGRIAQCYQSGVTPTGHLTAQYRALAGDFGLTPVAQSKVQPCGKKETTNRFANNGSRDTAKDE
jgi:phage terminase small subunit